MSLYQDTTRIATGCQDGLVRVYDSCAPSQTATEYKVSASIADGITKLCWSAADKDVLIIGKKSGVLEKWDVRVGGSGGAVQTATVPGGETLMDFEVSNRHGVVMAASGKKVSLFCVRLCVALRAAAEGMSGSQVCAFNSADFSLRQEYEMPAPMTFKEEGGVSLSPDGSKFFAVREIDTRTQLFIECVN